LNIVIIAVIGLAVAVLLGVLMSRIDKNIHETNQTPKDQKKDK